MLKQKQLWSRLVAVFMKKAPGSGSGEAKKRDEVEMGLWLEVEGREQAGTQCKSGLSPRGDGFQRSGYGGQAAQGWRRTRDYEAGSGPSRPGRASTGANGSQRSASLSWEGLGTVERRMGKRGALRLARPTSTSLPQYAGDVRLHGQHKR